MTYASKPVICAAAFLLMSSVAVFAQAGGGSSGGGASAGSASSGGATGGAAGTNSAGTANSSGGGGGVGAGAGGAPSPDGKPTTGDAKTDAQDREVDKKVKNICKGC